MTIEMPLPDYTVCQQCIFLECWTSPVYCPCSCHHQPEEPNG